VTPEERIAAFERMVEQRPDEPFARYSLAMALRSAGREPEAAAAFEELRRRSPGYVPTYLMLGQVLEALARPVEAEQAYRAGIETARKAGDEHARGELAQALEVLQAQRS